MADYMGRIIAKCLTDLHSPDETVSSVVSPTYTAIDITDNNNFATVPNEHVTVDTKTVVHTAHLAILNRSLLLAQQACLTQGYPITQVQEDGTVHHSALVSSFHTNTCTIHYQHLHFTMFQDTMYVSTISQDGNRCTQIFSSSCRWPYAYPMKTKG